MTDIEDLTNKELIKEFYIVKRELEHRNISMAQLINNPDIEDD